MSYCAIHIKGDKFNPSSIFSHCSLTPDSIYLKGVFQKGKVRPSDTNGVRFDIADGSFDQQISDAEEFLVTHIVELENLTSSSGVEYAFINFFYELDSNSNTAVYNRFFPASLISLCGKINLGICVSNFIKDT